MNPTASLENAGFPAVASAASSTPRVRWPQAYFHIRHRVRRVLVMEESTAANNRRANRRGHSTAAQLLPLPHTKSEVEEKLAFLSLEPDPPNACLAPPSFACGERKKYSLLSLASTFLHIPTTHLSQSRTRAFAPTAPSTRLYTPLLLSLFPHPEKVIPLDMG